MPTFDIAKVLITIGNWLVVILLITGFINATVYSHELVMGLFDEILLSDRPVFTGFVIGLSFLPNNTGTCIIMMSTAIITKFVMRSMVTVSLLFKPR